MKTLLQPLWKYACSLTVMSFRCLPKRCSYDRCTTVFFLNRPRLELQTAPCEGIHRKVDMKGVFRVFLPNFDHDVYIVTKEAPVQSCRALDKSQIFTRRWLTDNFHWPCTTSLSITQRANSCSNGRQWKQMGGNGNLLFMGLITICSSRIWILPACDIALPEGTWILSGVLTVQLPTKDIDNIPARTCTNTPH